MRIRSSNRLPPLPPAPAALAGAGLTALVGGTAEAIPVPQKQCNFNYQTIKAEDGWRPMGMGVTVRNGDSPRKLVAQLAADLGVDTLAEVRVGYQIDGGPVQERVFGPANLANHTEYWQTRSTIAVIPTPRGTHTVTPYWRVSGSTGKQAYFQTGCFTVEGRTR